jgi:hypothetical protein
MKLSKESQKPQLTPFEKLRTARMNRNALVAVYVLTMRAIADSIKSSGAIDKHAITILAEIAQQTETRLGISA